MVRVVLFSCLVVVFGACRNPVGPDGFVGLPQWSPYLGVHPFEAQRNVQQPYLEPLLKNGTVKGLRLDLEGQDSELFASWVLANGGDVLAIFPNEHLRKPDVADILAGQMVRNPGIRYWEIGNELDVFTDISASEYLPIFLSLHAMAQERFPENIIIPQAPCGGCEGAKIFEEMLDGGLLRLAREGRLPVISIHYYSLKSVYLFDIAREIQRLPISTEIWVTETGIDDPKRHVEHVQTQYPRIRSQVRASRIYWYVFSSCDGYSLIGGLAASCRLDQPQPSELYQLLAGGGG